MTTTADNIAASNGTYSVSSYRYARNCLVVRTPSSNGWKTRAARLIEGLGGRWVHRAGGYVASASKVAKFERMFRDGWDANFITAELIAPADQAPEALETTEATAMPSEAIDNSEPEVDTLPVPTNAAGSSALRFYWNGIKDAKDAKLQKAGYSAGSLRSSPEGTITIYARHYQRFSAAVRAQFFVENGTDTQSDYFENDRIRVTPDHPLYGQVVAAFEAQELHNAKRLAKRGVVVEPRKLQAPSPAGVQGAPVPENDQIPPVPVQPVPVPEPRPMATIHTLPVRTRLGHGAQNTAHAAENCGIFQRVAAIEFTALHLPRQGFPYHAANSPTRPS